MVWSFVPGAVGLALTLNAWRPINWPAPVALASFFAGWLTTELALHHIAWQVAYAAWLVMHGGLHAWPGVVGLACVALSCCGLLLLHVRGAHAGANIDTAIRDAFGRERDGRGHGFSWWRVLFPFSLGHKDVITVRNIPFAHVGGVDLKLDVHRPRELPTRAPVLVYVHGGGWIVGFRERQGLPLMRHLASRGWVCFSVDYRLSPRATFPDHLVDVKRALAWVKEHAEENGGDPDMIVLCGNSAGAHLASLMALTANEERYQPGFEDVDTSVQGCIACYGIYDFTDRHKHFPNRGFARLIEHLVMKKPRAHAPEEYCRASPFFRVHEGAPPFLVVHGDRDSLAPTGESRRFVEALREKKVPVAYAEIPDAQHAFEVFSSPRALHFVSGATAFVEHVRDRHEAERAAYLAVGSRARSGIRMKDDEAAEAAEPGETGELAEASGGEPAEENVA
jgi:acetyl esterase/lipase